MLIVRRKPILTTVAPLCLMLAALLGFVPHSSLAAYGPGVPVAQMPPPGPGLARVWILRTWDPINMVGTPMVYVNGVPFGPSAAGTAFYRDLPAGSYVFSVDSCTKDVNQDARLTLAPGMQLNLEVQYLQNFTSLGCFTPGAYYVRPIASHVAQMYMQQLSFLGAR